MNNLSKVDKEILITLVAVIIAALLAIFAIYKHLNVSPSSVQNLTGGAQTEQKTK